MSKKVKTRKTLPLHDWRRHPVDCPRCQVSVVEGQWYPMHKHHKSSKKQLATLYELSALQRKEAKRKKKLKAKKKKGKKHAA